MYRLVMAMILHAGALHWLMNTVTLVVFCAQVEASIDFKVYLLVYIIGGIQGIAYC